jgi:TP901 family phage tail tape measure protein
MPVPLVARLELNAGTFPTVIRKLKGELTGFGSSLKSLGSSFAMALGAAAIPLGLMIRHANEFEAQMARLKAIVGPTDAELAKLNASAKDMSVQFGRASSEVASGMVMLGQAGMSTKEILGALPGVFNLAAIGGISLAEAADTTAIALRVYGKSAQDANKISSQFAYVQSKANTNVQEMAEAFKYAAPVAAQLKIPMEQVNAAIGIMADAGIKGSMGGTALRGSLLRLIAPGNEAAEVLKAFGVNVVNTDGTVKDLVGIVSELEKVQLGATDKAKLFSVVFGQRAVSGMLALMNTQKEVNGQMLKGSGLLRAFAEDIKKNDDFATKGGETIRATLGTAFDRLSASFWKASDAFVNSFGGPMRDFLNNTLSPMFVQLAGWIETNKTLKTGFQDFFVGVKDVAEAGKVVFKSLEPLANAMIETLFGVDLGIGDMAWSFAQFMDEHQWDFVIMFYEARDAWDEFYGKAVEGWEHLRELVGGPSSFKDALEKAFTLTKGLAGVFGWVYDQAEWAVGGVADLLGEAFGFVENTMIPDITAQIDDMAKKFIGAFLRVRNYLSEFVEDSKKILAGFWESMTQAFANVTTKIKQFFFDAKNLLSRLPGMGGASAWQPGATVQTTGTSMQPTGSVMGAGGAIIGDQSGTYLQGGKQAGQSWSQGMTEGILTGATFGIYPALKNVGDYLIGKSPPPKGSLRLLDIGGWNAAKAWGDSFVAALERVEGPAKTAATSIAVALTNNQQKTFEALAERMVLTKDQWIAVLGEIYQLQDDFGLAFQTRMEMMTLGFQENAILWSETFAGFFGTIEQGLADTVNAVIFGGESISAIWKKVGQDMVKSMIATFVKIQMQNLITAIFGKKAKEVEGKHKVAVDATTAGTSATATAAAVMPAPMAKAVGVAMKASVLATGMAGIGAAAGMFGGLPGIETVGGGVQGAAEGALVRRPTIVQVAEGGEPEFIAPLSKAVPLIAEAMRRAGGAGMAAASNTGVGASAVNLYVTVNVTAPSPGLMLPEDVGVAVANTLTDLAERGRIDLLATRAYSAERVEYGV